jgi:hypothetical protein
MSPDLDRLVLVSCRHCLRPISLTSEIDHRERAALRVHVRDCATTDPVELGPEADELLRHCRLARDLSVTRPAGSAGPTP